MNDSINTNVDISEVLPPWSLDGGIRVARAIEQISVPLGWHVALGGSVLHAGYSNKDLDLIIYKRTKAEQHTVPQELMEKLTCFGFTCFDADVVDNSGGSDFRQIFRTNYLNRRVDFIFILD